jgi:hypothetical protein
MLILWAAGWLVGLTGLENAMFGILTTTAQESKSWLLQEGGLEENGVW